MEKQMTNQELLSYPVGTYNEALTKSNPNVEFSECQHCSRFYDMVCICDQAQEDWQAVIDEVREVSEMNNRPSSSEKPKHIKELIEDIFHQINAEGMDLPFDQSDVEKALELYGKEVARNVRHKAAEISNSVCAKINESPYYSLPSHLAKGIDNNIMAIQFKDVDSSPK